MAPKSIVLAGGSGFIGRALASEFSALGFEVTVLTRSPGPGRGKLPAPLPRGVREAAWDGARPGAWTGLLEEAAAVINLAGKNINCPHTPENLRAITASRVDSVTAIAAAIGQAQSPPRAWVQASAVGFYGDTGASVCDENSAAGRGTLANVCRQWEAGFANAQLPATRKAALRIGTVLGRDGGALPLLSRMTRWFLGGAAGAGSQYMSWIHEADLAAVFVAMVTDEKFSGVYNTVSPGAVTNAQFMRELRRVQHRPWSPPAPAWAVSIGARLMKSEGSLALASHRCAPKRLLDAGFQFRFPDLAAALEDLARPAPC